MKHPYTHVGRPTPRRVAARILHGISDWARRNRTAREWMERGSDERRALLADLGLTGSDTATLYADPAAPQRQLPRMARIFGAQGMSDPRYAGVRRDMERVCSLCPVQHQCRRVLAGSPGPEDCGFCPNRQTLAALC